MNSIDAQLLLGDKIGSEGTEDEQSDYLSSWTISHLQSHKRLRSWLKDR
jgi:hypothetical protein